MGQGGPSRPAMAWLREPGYGTKRRLSITWGSSELSTILIVKSECDPSIARRTGGGRLKVAVENSPSGLPVSSTAPRNALKMPADGQLTNSCVCPNQKALAGVSVRLTSYASLVVTPVKSEVSNGTDT